MRGPRLWAIRAISLLTLALCVWRANEARAFAPPCRYVLSGVGTPNDTTYDLVTGLTWQRTVSPNTYSWADAQTACTTLNYAGFSSGWRVPAVRELQSIVDYTRTRPSIDIFAFPHNPIAMFWTSNPYEGSTSSGFAWYVDFTDGSVDADDPGDSFYVRCVR